MANYNGGVFKSNGVELAKINASNITDPQAWRDKLGIEWFYHDKQNKSGFTSFWYPVPDIDVYDYKFVFDEFQQNNNEIELRFGVATADGGALNAASYEYVVANGWGESVYTNKSRGVSIIRVRGKSNNTAETIIRYDAAITVGIGSGTMENKSHVFRYWSSFQGTGMTVNYSGIVGYSSGTTYGSNGRWLRFNGTTINGDGDRSIAQCKFRVYKRKKAVY